MKKIIWIDQDLWEELTEEMFTNLPSEFEEVRNNGSLLLKQLLEAGLITPEEAEKKAKMYGYSLSPSEE